MNDEQTEEIEMIDNIITSKEAELADLMIDEGAKVLEEDIDNSLFPEIDPNNNILEQ